MPSKSAAQARFMEMVAKKKGKGKKGFPPKKVAKEFASADKGAGGYFGKKAKDQSEALR